MCIGKYPKHCCDLPHLTFEFRRLNVIYFQNTEVLKSEKLI
jgi:hypothetical protein